jgi:hypothetical protein
MDNFNNLTTPEEFIGHYFDQLRTDLATQNIQLSKVGFAGYMLNLLGNTQYDAKTYYDNLFKEAFPITALDDKNLGYHGNVFGYTPALADYAVIDGIFEYSLDSLPVMLTNISKREIILSNVILNIEGLSYTLDSEYKIIINKSGSSTSGYSSIITDEAKQKTIPFQISDPVSKVFDLNQYVREVTTFVAADYIYGTYYSYEIEIPADDYVTKIDITVDGVEFGLSKNKSFAAGDEKVVFYEITPDNVLLLELGSGLHGEYVPGSTVSVTVYKTKGDLGNIGTQVSRDFTSGNIQVYDYGTNGDLVNQLVNPIGMNNFLSVNINKGTRGKNPLQGLDLRKDLIKFIQSRNNLMSETDFRQILDNYFQDFEIIFKKTKLCENVFYVYQYFTDRFMNPIYTLSSTVSKTDFTSTMVDNSIYYPEFEIEGEAFISPFLYIYDELMNVYNGFIVKKEPVFYPTSLSTVDPDDTDNPPLVFIQLEYNVNTTTIYVKSYQDISDYKFTLNIPTLEMANIILNPSVEENTLEYNYNGIITDIVDITIDVYDIYDIHKFSTLFEEVRQVVDISDILQMKTYMKTDLDHYFVNLMLIHKDTYLADEEYYLDKIIGILGNVDLEENRMMNDDVQVRFLNTYFVNATYFRKTTLQNHNIGTIESTEIELRADDTTGGNSLGGTYFELDSIDNQYYVWFSIDGENNSDPRPDLDDSMATKKEEIMINIQPDATVGEIRTAIMEGFANYKGGEIFTAYNYADCPTVLLPDNLVRVETLDGGAHKNIRDPDPLSNNPDLPTGFIFTVAVEGVDIGIKLPLKLKIELSADKSVIVSQNLALATELDKIKLELATFLFEDKTKIYLKFYGSEIVDILHNYDWVKSAKASVVSSDGKAIPDSSIEIYAYDKIEGDLKKEELLDYAPMLWYWDLNDIEIAYTI